MFFNDGTVLEGKEFGGGTAADSDKLGGKAPEYYIQPRNLLDNSDFRNPVNQRGETSHSGKGYFIDRWKNDHIDMTTEIHDGYVSFTNNSASSRAAFTQNLIGDHIGKTYTIAVCDHDTGGVYCKSFVVPTATESAQYLSGADFGGSSFRPGVEKDGSLFVQVMTAIGETSNVEWVALYEGAYTAETLPPYSPKGYAAELAECQRYYFTYGSLRLLLLHNVDGVDRGTFLFPTEMRIIPTLSYEITGDVGPQFTLEETTKQGFSCYATGVTGCVQLVNCIANADL